MSLSKGISPFLWFGGKAKEAVEHYVSVFPNSRITNVIEIPAGPAKGAAQIEFELDGLTCTALDGGPMFEMTPAISFVVPCESQEEIDYYWDKLAEGGTQGFCGWLTDPFGLSWQVVPANLDELMARAPTAIMESLVKDAKSRLIPILLADRLEYPIVIADERWKVVIPDVAHGVPAMISEVVDDDVKIV